MKFCKYFFFVLRNWNLRLAIFSVYHEIRGEKKYQIHTTGINNLKDLEVHSDHKENAFIYQPVNYYMLEKALRYVREAGATGNLVDYGCGEGRILAVSAAFGFKTIKGIDFAPDFCAIAERNIAPLRIKYPDTNFNISCIDAIQYQVDKNDHVLTFFNPFDEGVMIPVVRNILESLKTNPREIFVIYFNPTEVDIFLSAGFEQIAYFEKMEYLDYSILLFSPGG